MKKKVVQPSKAKVGAIVRYCGHRGVFLADVMEVAGACVIRASSNNIDENLNRNPLAWDNATHHVVDFPVGGYWKPRQGILVVPSEQVQLVEESKQPLKDKK